MRVSRADTEALGAPPKLTHANLGIAIRPTLGLDTTAVDRRRSCRDRVKPDDSETLMNNMPPPNPLFSIQQQVQPPQDIAVYPAERTAEELAAIQRHLGTLAVSNQMGWSGQPR